jgi:hypothetical protein
MKPQRFGVEEEICQENECPESGRSARNWTGLGVPCV